MFRGMNEGMGAGGWVLMIVFGTALLGVDRMGDRQNRPEPHRRWSGAVGARQTGRLRSSTGGSPAARSTLRPTSSCARS